MYEDHLEAVYEDHLEAVYEDHLEAVYEDHLEAVSEDHLEAVYEDHLEAVYEDHLEAVGEDHLEAVGEDHLEAVGEDHLEAVGEDHLEAVGEDHLEAVGEDHLEAVGEDHLLHDLTSFRVPTDFVPSFPTASFRFVAFPLQETSSSFPPCALHCTLPTDVALQLEDVRSVRSLLLTSARRCAGIQSELVSSFPTELVQRVVEDLLVADSPMTLAAAERAFLGVEVVLREVSTPP